MRFDLPYLVEDLDRHGNVRVYFRRGRTKVRLRERPGSAEFLARYWELRRGWPPPAPPDVGAGPRPATWRWLCVQYLGSATFRALDPVTQRRRRSLLEATFEEPLRPDSDKRYADYPLASMGRAAVRVLRDRKAAKPEGANNTLKALRAVFAWAVEEEVGGIEVSPAEGVRKLKPANASGFHRWLPAEVERYEARHLVGTKARLALDLLVYTGVRRSDVIRLGRQHEQDGWLRFRTFKGRHRDLPLLEIPILPVLRATIDASPTGALTYLVTEHGKPFASGAAFGNKFRQWCDEAGLPQCSAHGLRKAGATRAADNGASAHELMAIFNWMSLREAERYTREAERRRLAGRAMPLLMRPKP